MSGTSEHISSDWADTRFHTLYKQWPDDLDSILILTGKTRPEDSPDFVSKPGSFHLWLFTLIFPETLVIFFSDRTICFCAKNKKLAYFKDLNTTTVGQKFKLKFFPKESSSPLEPGLVELLKSYKAGDDRNLPLRVGTIKDVNGRVPIGPLSEGWIKALNYPAAGVDETYIASEDASDEFHFRWRSVDDMVTRLVMIQDDLGMKIGRLAGIACGRMCKEVLINRVVTILDEEIQESHADLCALAEKVLDDEEKMNKWQSKYSIDPAGLDVAQTLCESCESNTHTFKLKWSEIPTKEPLYLGRGSVVIGCGMKYNNQVCYIARTIMLDVGKEEKEVYRQTLKLQDHIRSLIQPGKTFREVYDGIIAHISADHVSLKPYIIPVFGAALTHTQDNPGFQLSEESSNETIEAGMFLSFGVAVANIPIAENSGRPIAVWLYDTGPVTDKGIELPNVWTACCTKNLEGVVYSLEDDTAAAGKSKTASAATKSRKEREEGNSHSAAKSEPAGGTSGATVAIRVRSRRATAGMNQQEQDKQLQKQRDLRRKKYEEIRERFRDGETGFTKDKKTIKKLSQCIAYRDAQEYPKDLRPGRVHLDTVREALLIPIGNVHVPFHVSMVRNVSHQEEDQGSRTHVLRISFKVPGTTAVVNKAEENPLPDLSDVSNSLFIRELIVKSADPGLATTFKNIRELMKRAKNRELHKADEDVTIQQALQVNRTGRRLILRNLMVRHIGGHSRKGLGQVEAHVNGFRYTAPKMEAIDIIYTNVRHAFFHPVANEMIILLHFHLKSPIIIQKKKVKDIQFYCETASQTDDLDARRARSAYDPDEILEEQREQERKKRLNLEFKRFVEQSMEMAGGALRFEVPIRKLAFHGVPRNSSVTLFPTTNCLVSLTEWPSFVLCMDDVELVSFERVVHGLRHFDIIFVFKDYNRSVCPVSNVPVDSLDMVKLWLNDMDIVWYEGKNNLTWAAILKTIRSNISAFVKDGGFSSFLGDEPEVKRQKQRHDGDADGGDDDESEDDANGSPSDSGDDDDDDDESDDEYQEGSSSEDEDFSEEEEGSDDEGDDEEKGSNDEEGGGSDDEDDDDDDDEGGESESGVDLSEDSEEEEEEQRSAQIKRKHQNNARPNKKQRK